MNNSEQQVNSNQEFYGSDAVTGNEETTTEALMQVKTSPASTQVQLNTTNEESLAGENQELPQDETNEENEETTTDEAVEASLQDQLKTVDNIGKALTAKGVNFGAITKEYEANGRLSRATYETLAEAGYPKGVVDGIIKANEVVAEQFVNAVVNFVGGEKAYQQIAQYMESNLSKSELNAYNRALDKGDMGTIKLFLSGIKSKIGAFTGTANRTIMGRASGQSSGQSRGFANKQEMIEALSDKRYGVDPEYTRQCERKVYYSNFM